MAHDFWSRASDSFVKSDSDTSSMQLVQDGQWHGFEKHFRILAPKEGPIPYAGHLVTIPGRERPVWVYCMASPSKFTDEDVNVEGIERCRSIKIPGVCPNGLHDDYPITNRDTQYKALVWEYGDFDVRKGACEHLYVLRSPANRWNMMFEALRVAEAQGLSGDIRRLDWTIRAEKAQGRIPYRYKIEPCVTKPYRAEIQRLDPSKQVPENDQQAFQMFLQLVMGTKERQERWKFLETQRLSPAMTEKEIRERLGQEDASSQPRTGTPVGDVSELWGETDTQEAPKTEVEAEDPQPSPDVAELAQAAQESPATVNAGAAFDEFLHGGD